MVSLQASSPDERGSGTERTTKTPRHKEDVQGRQAGAHYLPLCVLVSWWFVPSRPYLRLAAAPFLRLFEGDEEVGGEEGAGDGAAVEEDGEGGAGGLEAEVDQGEEGAVGAVEEGRGDGGE